MSLRIILLILFIFSLQGCIENKVSMNDLIMATLSESDKNESILLHGLPSPEDWKEGVSRERFDTILFNQKLYKLDIDQLNQIGIPSSSQVKDLAASLNLDELNDFDFGATHFAKHAFSLYYLPTFKPMVKKIEFIYPLEYSIADSTFIMSGYKNINGNPQVYIYHLKNGHLHFSKIVGVDKNIVH